MHALFHIKSLQLLYSGFASQLWSVGSCRGRSGNLYKSNDENIVCVGVLAHARADGQQQPEGLLVEETHLLYANSS